MNPSPTVIDLLIEARWVVPVEPHAVVLDDHAVAIHEGNIVAIVPISEARTLYTPRERVELAEHALIPGLINAHTHNPMTLMRGLADDLPLMTWLQQHIWPAEGRVMGPEFIRDGVELAVAEMIRGGTTCANENYFFPDVIASTYQSMGFRAVVGLPVIEFPSPWAKTRDEYFARAEQVHHDLKGDSLITTSFVPHAPYTVSDESFERIREQSAQWDIPVHLHTHETAQEVEESIRDHGMRPLERLQRLGIINERLIAVHMTQLTDGEIAMCAAAGVSVVHCPESNLKLASGFCPAEKLRAAGVNVAIGTDGCASNNDLDMFGEMRTAALLAKAVASDAAAFDAAFALRAATLNGAMAMGLGDRVGSIEVGKRADLAAIRLDDLETQPLYHVASQLVYSTGRHQVSDVWIDGKRKLAGNVLVDVDVDGIRAKARRWRDIIAAGDVQ
ncbi:5-methylthioadenosine/S-adenosylhomocysteine deaminase [Luteibacter sp. Sphag1AF]|uniref:TRZ/ATZ family hydrolase n=1 Tax=Luteibacter sp. Sphag1AF TaxID=2587031 RepID=UPI001622536E|nr:TRZ/ATZ family hydrolase [Luteibacter sp. Sphag1AF]MBB3227191.1 5-methylthioadenosine/S-adenosylhomocysteine deaminase [Luteibacter sp. Sphag1AF]